MVEIIGYNVKLKKKEKMNNPKGFFMTVKDKKRYMVCGKGSDGTKMCAILGDNKAEKLIQDGFNFVKKEKKGG